MRRLLAIAVIAGACAPTVDGPVAQQRTRDHADAASLTAQLARLPGAVAAQASIVRAVRDPLSSDGSIARAGAAAVILVDDAADRGQVERAAVVLIRATAPEVVAPSVIVMATAPHTELAKVGPFFVAATSRGPLKATLAIALAAIAALAGWIALLASRK